jgi:hypothetical protein
MMSRADLNKNYPKILVIGALIGLASVVLLGARTTPLRIADRNTDSVAFYWPVPMRQDGSGRFARTYELTGIRRLFLEEGQVASKETESLNWKRRSQDKLLVRSPPCAWDYSVEASTLYTLTFSKRSAISIRFTKEYRSERFPSTIEPAKPRGRKHILF